MPTFITITLIAATDMKLHAYALLKFNHHLLIIVKCTCQLNTFSDEYITADASLLKSFIRKVYSQKE